jgi:hypothetical protein
MPGLPLMLLRSFPETGLRSRWHHQHHGPGVPGQLERHEIPDPVRSDAVKALFQCVRQASGSGPIFMTNLSSAASSWGSVNIASTSYDLVWVVLE